MPLPETIPVKYTEEEAEYLSVRPVVRQTFRLRELVDMVLAVTGKDAARVQQVLRAGTAVFHFYRYWWPALEAGEKELAPLLAEFPDPWPERPFRAGECTLVQLESAAGRAAMRLEKASASKRRPFRRGSVWDCLSEQAARAIPRYDGYSYDQRADRFALALDAAAWPALRDELLRCTPRNLRPPLAAASGVTRILYFCPRR